MLNILAKGISFTGEGAVIGLYVLLLGMAFVFIGIVIIVLVVTLLGKLMKKYGYLFDAPSKKKDKKQSQPVKSVEVSNNNSNNQDEISPEIKAAIIAAISAVYFEQGSSCEFRIKKIKRI